MNEVRNACSTTTSDTANPAATSPRRTRWWLITLVPCRSCTSGAPGRSASSGSSTAGSGSAATVTSRAAATAAARVSATTTATTSPWQRIVSPASMW